MKKWPHKCAGWKASEEDPSFCASCGNIASAHKGPTPGAPRQFRMTVPVKPASTVYSQPACIFNYCPHPEACQSAPGKCLNPR